MKLRKRTSESIDVLFYEYFLEWVETYKEGLVKQVTLNKYLMTYQKLKLLAPNLQLRDLNRREYQKIINLYGETHEKQTTMDFHHQVKAAAQGAFHDGLLDRDPSYKAVIKGMTATRNKKQKFLSHAELKKLIATLDLTKDVTDGWDWFTLILAKTGMRFAEGLAITPNDFDLKTNSLNINKTWDYKSSKGKFDITKNTSSNRNIVLDWQIIGQFIPLIKDLPADEPIFVPKDKRIYNSTVNVFLRRKCLEADVDIISVHSLRHTHASVLLAEGISIHSISQRLGHSNVTTTQEVYTHIIDELKQKDDSQMVSALTSL